MKTIATISVLLLAASSSYAVNLECTATEVSDTSYLEESFTVEEYPDVRVTDAEVSLGASLFSVENGDEITVLPSVGMNQSVQIKQANNGPIYTVNVHVSPTDKSGTVSAQDDASSPAGEIAKITCK